MELQQVPQYYDRASHWYDFLTRLVLDRLLGLGEMRSHTLDRLGDVKSGRVLDLGCGTGLNFGGILRRIGSEGQLVGVDYSQGMLAKARERIKQKGWHDQITLVRDDAASLARVAPCFDAVLSYWCLGIVHDLIAALQQVLRVLQPGGRVVILDFHRAKPETGVLRWLYPFYKRLLIWAGIDTSGDLDDQALQRKWKEGKTFLKARLENYQEQTYLQGAGVLISGALPAEAVSRV